jgi:hypothetical protein
VYDASVQARHRGELQPVGDASDDLMMEVPCGFDKPADAT